MKMSFPRGVTMVLRQYLGAQTPDFFLELCVHIIPLLFFSRQLPESNSTLQTQQMPLLSLANNEAENQKMLPEMFFPLEYLPGTSQEAKCGLYT